MRPTLVYASLLPGFDQMLTQETVRDNVLPTNLDKVRYNLRDHANFEQMEEFIEEADWATNPDEMNLDASLSHFLLDIKLNNNQV
jgi:hypothetical protein